MVRTTVVIAFFLALFPHYSVQASYSVGRGIADVTGPPVGVQMWGFVREGQITEGIHFRLFSRAFVIADEDGGRMAFASVDIGSITHAMHAEIVDRIQAELGEAYTQANVIVSATHTHGGPGGFWHSGVGSPIGSAFYVEHFDAIVSGIVDSIVQAHRDLTPGSVLVGQGDVAGGGANRSIAAYDNNPAAERGRYAGATDTGMTLLKFLQGDEAVGMVNWFASHPTAMNFYNQLISGDHKGHASARFEAGRGDGFVAAFAQSNAGDISPNLNLDNTGPGETDFETTQIIAERQLAVAESVFDTASEALSGPIAMRHAFVNFAWLPVSDEFTGAGEQTTCPSAYGYAFAAGSTEDGGGHPLFKEGMKVRNAMIDGTVKQMFQLPDPSDECRECHGEKVILFAAGELDPPGQTQILPLTLAQAGQLTLVVVPAEFTTMAGRRLRETVAKELGARSRHVVLVGYANDYGGYVTTREEYATQQYEGGHTLYGPWTLAAYEQEFTRLARALVAGEAVDAGPSPRDLRGTVPETLLSAAPNTLPDRVTFGALDSDAKRSYKAGATVEVSFWSGHPANDFATGNSYLAIQRAEGADWVNVATDNDWSTKCRWVSSAEAPTQSRFEVTWETTEETAGGDYRIMHWGRFVDGAGEVQRFEGASRTFKIK